MTTLKRKYIIYLAALMVLMSAAACSKILEQQPKNSTYLQQFWKSANDCEYAIAGNYALLRVAFTDFNNRYYMYGDAVANTYFTIDYNGDGLEGIQTGNFTFQYNLEALGNWTKYYKVIAMSNTILKQVPKITDEQLESSGSVDDPAVYRNKILGEALFIRALMYFQMVKIWGDVPLVTEAYDDPIAAPQLPRSARADVMGQIEKDCLQAAGLLQWGYQNKQDLAVRANKGSVFALLAHFYLWRATTTNLASADPVMADVDKASSAIDSITTFGGYMLVDTAAYGKQFIGRSSESIFEIYMSEDAKEGSFNHIGFQFLTDRYVNGYGTGHRFWVPPAYLNNHYYTSPIYDGGTDSSYSDTLDVRFRNNFDLVHDAKPTCRKYANVTYRNPGTQTDPYLSNDMIIFRLSDMLLLKAEIALYKDDINTAVDIINGWRQRNGGSSFFFVDNTWSKDDLMYEYILERGKELYLEGHIFWDLIRTRQYVNFIPWLSEGRFQQGGFYWPVDPTLFRDNRFLVQTTYWKGKV
jgi:hypothetical protein